MTRRIITAAAVAALAATTSFADHRNLEEGFPTTIEDAYPLGYGAREFQTFFRYQQEDDGVDSFTINTQIEIGFPRNAQIKVAAPFIFGEIEPDGVGDVEVEFLYNINQETLVLPAFAVAAGVELPTGEQSHGLDPFVKVIATKTLGNTWWLHQIHGNFEYHWNDDVQAGERTGHWRAAAGYSVRLNNEMVLVADYVRELRRQEDVEWNLIELGIRWQLTPNIVVSFGPGFGLGDESPDIRGTFGIQVGF